MQVKTITRVLLYLSMLLMAAILWQHTEKLTTYQMRETIFAPVDAFALIETEITVLPEDVIREVSAGGSGIVFHIEDGYSYVITANHVCIPPFVPELNKEFSAENISINNHIVDFYGTVREATIVFNDRVKDLCILKIKGEWTTPVRIAEEEPLIGERVYSISAPKLFFYPGVVPIFDGYYSGTISDLIDPDAVYTIPTRSGSSGSAVLNQDFEIIGIVHSAIWDLSNVGIACTYDELKEFIAEYEALSGVNVH